jgi:hypothetical protein
VNYLHVSVDWNMSDRRLEQGARQTPETLNMRSLRASLCNGCNKNCGSYDKCQFGQEYFRRMEHDGARHEKTGAK